MRTEPRGLLAVAVVGVRGQQLSAQLERCAWMEAVWLLLDGGAPPSSTRFGFSWNGPFRCENPRFWGLEKLGFPWILSSKTRLINGLNEIFRGSFFLALLSSRKSRRNGGPTIRHAEGMDCSWDKLSLISDFLQEIAALLFGPASIQKPIALLVGRNDDRDLVARDAAELNRQRAGR